MKFDEKTEKLTVDVKEIFYTLECSDWGKGDGSMKKYPLKDPILMVELHEAVFGHKTLKGVSISELSYVKEGNHVVYVNLLMISSAGNKFEVFAGSKNEEHLGSEKEFWSDFEK